MFKALLLLLLVLSFIMSPFPSLPLPSCFHSKCHTCSSLHYTDPCVVCDCCSVPVHNAHFYLTFWLFFRLFFTSVHDCSLQRSKRSSFTPQPLYSVLSVVLYGNSVSVLYVLCVFTTAVFLHDCLMNINQHSHLKSANPLWKRVRNNNKTGENTQLL